MSPTPTPKKAKYLAHEYGRGRTPQRAGHGNKIAEGLLRSLANSGTWVSNKCSWRNGRQWEKLAVAKDADVVLPLSSDAAALPGETVVSAEVDFDIASADLGGSEGAAATEQAERTVGDVGGNVTPTAVPDHEAEEEEDKGPEGGSEDDMDF